MNKMDDGRVKMRKKGMKLWKGANFNIRGMCIEMEKSCLSVGHIEKDRYWHLGMLNNLKGCRGETCSACKEE